MAEFDPLDPNSIKPEVQIHQRATQHVRKHKLIPVHAELTLKKWDDFRAAEQERYAAMSPAEQKAEFASLLDLPTPELTVYNEPVEAERKPSWITRLFSKIESLFRKALAFIGH